MPKKPTNPSKSGSTWHKTDNQRSGRVQQRDHSGMEPDTGKRGVQPEGSVKPYPPRPVPPIVHVEKER